MCKYLQNAPKTLANRREAPSLVPWLIAFFVVTETVTRSFPFLLYIHPHTYTQRYLCLSMYCGCCRCHCHRCLSFLSTHTHTNSHTHSGFFLLLLCCHICCRDIVSNIVVAFATSHFWGPTQTSPTAEYMTHAIIILCPSYRLTLNIY